MRRKQNSGQALLIILLIMAVALTIGLSVVSRSITDIRISQEQEESARAFSLAEAGLESLLAGEDLPSFEGFKITKEEEELGNKSTYVYPETVKAGNTITVWLVDHTDEGDLGSNFYTGSEITFYWGNESFEEGEPWPALEAVIIYKDVAGEYQTRRVAFDPDSDRVAKNDFTLVDKGTHSLEDETFSFKAAFTENDDGVDFPAGDLYAARIKLLYNTNKQLLGVEGDAGLPLQGHCYRVAASKEETGIARKVEQCQLYKSLPAIFDYVLFSESGLAK